MSRERLTFRQLEAVQTVLEFGSISMAAKQLGISQPTLSGLISDLESELGTAMFVRSGKGLIPTEHAMQLKADLDGSVADVRQVFRKARSLVRDDSDTIRIGCMPSIAAGLAYAWDHARGAGKSARKLRLKAASARRIVADLKSREVDIGIVARPQIDPELECVRIGNYAFRAILGVPAFPALKDSISPADIGKLPILGIEDDEGSREIVEQWLGDSAAEYAPFMWMNFDLCVIPWVRRMQGIAIVDPHAAYAMRDLIASVRLDPEPRTELWVVYRAAMRDHAARKDLIADLNAFMRLERDFFSFQQEKKRRRKP